MKLGVAVDVGCSNDGGVMLLAATETRGSAFKHPSDLYRRAPATKALKRLASLTRGMLLNIT
jgi:hypothetical protein